MTVVSDAVASRKVVHNAKVVQPGVARGVTICSARLGGSIHSHEELRLRCMFTSIRKQEMHFVRMSWEREPEQASKVGG